MWYDLDIYKFAQHLLPPMLRKKRTFAFLCVLLLPFHLLVQTFQAFRKQSESNMNINGQVIYIEKILNDTFFLTNKEIYLSDIPDRQLYLYIRDEAAQALFYQRSESDVRQLYVQQRGEGNMDGNYIVNVPSFLADKEKVDGIRRIVEKYKPSGRKYIINIYEYE